MRGLKRRRGQGMTEYLMLVGLVALLMIAAVNLYGFRVDEAIQGSTLALVQHTDPPAPGTPNGAYKNGVEWRTDTGDTIRLRNEGGKWVPWSTATNRQYDRNTHGAIVRR